MTQGFLFIILTGVIALTIAFALATPVVEYSWSTQQCVQVLYGDGSCENLPEKYELRWIK